MNLKPCPSCGQDTPVENWDKRNAWIECDDFRCRVRGPVARFPDGQDEADNETFDLAAEYWNNMPRKEANR